MSNKRTFSKFSQSQENKKYCSVCHKAGKSEREYTSHYIKSTPGPNGIVICPTILSAECKFCFQLGHWASEEHCPALREKKKREKKEEYNRKCENFQPQAVAVKPILKKLNRYDALADSESAPSLEMKMEEFPALGNSSAKLRQLPTGTSYAEMAKKEPPIVFVREEETDPSEYAVLSRRVHFDKLEEKSNLFATAVTSGRAGNFEELEISEMSDMSDNEEERYCADEYYDEDDDDWGYVPQLAVRATSENW